MSSLSYLQSIIPPSQKAVNHPIAKYENYDLAARLSSGPVPPGTITAT